MPDIHALGAQPCEPGQVVIDRRDLTKDQDSHQPLYVLAVSETTAAEKQVVDTGKTVAEHNEGYPASDRVVRAAYETGLDEAYGDTWRREARAHGLVEAVRRLHERTGTYPRAYDFPESRLVPATVEVRIVPGANPDDEELATIQRRLARFLDPFGPDPEEVAADG